MSVSGDRRNVSNLDFHEIQLHILRQLGYRNKKTFSELQGDWDSSKVSFHINKLVEQGLIEKSGSEYSVTPKAKGILADIKYDEYNPPINLLNLVIFSPEGKVYLEYLSSNMDPLAQNHTPIISRIFKEEALEEKAKELFREKFGYKPNKVHKAGVLENILNFEDNISQHYIVHNFYVKSDEENGNFYSLDEIEDMEIMPGMSQIIERIWEEKDLPFMGRWDLTENGEFQLDQLEM